MTIIGNSLLFIATLLYFSLVTALYGKTPKGGDAVVSYLWGIIFINAALWICINLVSIIIAFKGGFDWISPSKTTRYLLVYLGLFFICLTPALSGLFKNEHNVPLLRFYSFFVPILVPLVLVVVAAILLNGSLRSAVPLTFYKWPLVLIAVIGLLGVAAGMVSLVSENIRNNTARVKEITEREDTNHQRILKEIDSCDVMVNMHHILVFTGDNQPPQIRDKAVAKVRTNPNWQQELIRVLDTHLAEEAFQFLASNPVDDPSLFTEPVRKGVLKQASLIRERIQRSSHPSHFYPGMFSWEVERVIRSVDRFKGMGTDYLPAMKELRAALDEPSEYKQTSFTCISPLDKWIKVNE